MAPCWRGLVFELLGRGSSAFNLLEEITLALKVGLLVHTYQSRILIKLWQTINANMEPQKCSFHSSQFYTTKIGAQRGLPSLTQFT